MYGNIIEKRSWPEFVMLLILLFITQGGAEWVEITQSTHRRNPFINTAKAEITSTELFRMYPNDTLTFPNRHMGQVKRVNNVGKVWGVSSATVKTPSIKIQEEALYNENTKRYFNNGKPAGFKKLFIQSNTEDRTNAGKEKWKSNKNHHKELSTNLDRLIMYDEITEHFAYSESEDRSYFSTKPTLAEYDKERQHTRNKTQFESDEITSENTKNTISSYSILTTDKSKKQNQHQTRKTDKESPIKSSNTDKIKQENLNKPDTENSYLQFAKPNNINLKLTEEQESEVITEAYHPSVQKLNKVLQDLIETLKKQNEVPINTNTTKLTKINDYQTGVKQQLSQKIDDEPPSDKNQLINSEAPPQIKINPYKSDPLVGLWKFLKVITDIISKNTRRDVKSKINYLENLKNNILYAIEDRIHEAWPDDHVDDADQRSWRTRTSRSVHGRGHVEFPSSEGALMSISFLTFAVFLIKLILQVIHTYKNKTMMVTPTMMAAMGRAVSAIRTNN